MPARPTWAHVGGTTAALRRALGVPRARTGVSRGPRSYEPVASEVRASEATSARVPSSAEGVSGSRTGPEASTRPARGRPAAPRTRCGDPCHLGGDAEARVVGRSAAAARGRGHVRAAGDVAARAVIDGWRRSSSLAQAVSSLYALGRGCPHDKTSRGTCTGPGLPRNRPYGRRRDEVSKASGARVRAALGHHAEPRRCSCDTRPNKRFHGQSEGQFRTLYGVPGCLDPVRGPGGGPKSRGARVRGAPGHADFRFGRHLPVRLQRPRLPPTLRGSLMRKARQPGGSPDRNERPHSGRPRRREPHPWPSLTCTPRGSGAARTADVDAPLPHTLCLLGSGRLGLGSQAL